MTDPRFERALEQFLAAQKQSRRRFLGRAGGAALALARPLDPARRLRRRRGHGRRRPRRRSADKAETVSHPKTEIGDWTFSNWPLYMDKKLLKAFDKKYGGKVKYLEDINDNYEFFGKVRQQLENGQPIGRDIVVLTDYMASRWSAIGYAEPIDKKNVPNAKNIVDNLATINYDPDRTYTLPVPVRAPSASATTSRRPARELKSVKDLFDPKFKGRVTMLSEPYDSASTVLLGDGIDARRPRSTRSSARSRRSTRPTRPASSGASPATTTRPTSPRATCGSRSPAPATSSSSRATTRTCASPTSRRATSRSTTT